MFGALICTYLVNNTVYLSVLNVSNILLPEAPCHSDAVDGVSPLADLITISRNVTSEYLSLSSSINLNDTPTKFTWSPMRAPIVSSTSTVPLVVRRNVLLTIF